MYAVVLRACPAHALPRVVPMLAAIFSVKEATAQAVASSTPIILVDDLQTAEAAALQILLGPLSTAGAEIAFDDNPAPELPKIDWPAKPRIYKQTFETHVASLSLALPLPGGNELPLIELLISRLVGSSSDSSGFVPTDAITPQRSSRPPSGALSRPSTNRFEFGGSELGEITPFSGNPMALSESGSRRAAVAAPAAPPSKAEVGSRMDQLFGSEEGLIPSANDIASIMDQLLPGEDVPAPPPAPPSGLRPAISARPSSSRPANPTSGAHRMPPAGGASGYSVFLAKIADAGRRDKAAPLLAEMLQISPAEAADLATKMVIPVLRGVSKDAAETAKRRFAEIGVLARIKEG